LLAVPLLFVLQNPPQRPRGFLCRSASLEVARSGFLRRRWERVKVATKLDSSLARILRDTGRISKLAVRSERVNEADANGLAGRWGLDPILAASLVDLEEWARCNMAACGLRWPGIYVISGYRPDPVERQLGPSPTTAARSLHMVKRDGAPASLAADLRVGNIPASVTPLEFFGWLATGWKIVTIGLGGRWGGDFQEPDINHFDLGNNSLLLPTWRD